MPKWASYKDLDQSQRVGQDKDDEKNEEKKKKCMHMVSWYSA